MSRAGMTQKQLFPSGEAERQRCQGVWPGFFFGAGVCVQTRVPAAPWGNSVRGALRPGPRLVVVNRVPRCCCPAAPAVRDGLQAGFMARWFVTLSSPYFRCQFALSS